MNSPLPKVTRRKFVAQSSAAVAGVAVASAAMPWFKARAAQPAGPFRSRWDLDLDRVWLGPEFWANPMQDWRVAGGRIECVNAAVDRQVHSLTRQLGAKPGTLAMSVKVGRVDGGMLAGKGSFGFRVGVLGTLKDYPELHDYRNNLWPSPAGGVYAGVTCDGGMVTNNVPRLDPPRTKVDLDRESVELRLIIEPKGQDYVAKLTVHDGKSGKQIGGSDLSPVSAGDLVGNIALIANFPGAAGGTNAKGKAKAKGKAAEGGYNPGTGQFWFSDWQIGGTKLVGHDDQAFGPILFNQYTLSGGVMKMTVQMPPIGAADNQSVRLQVAEGRGWKTISEETIHPQARTATFTVRDWDDTKDTAYRLAYLLKSKGGSVESYWTGTIRKDPKGQEEITVGDVSCNIHSIFPNVPLTQSMAKLNPDLLAFTGDQFYESCGGYGVQRSPLEPSINDYLRKWYFHGWTWRELTRDRPSVSLPDDHDVYQGNLWGEGGDGRKTTQEAGGYDLPAEWVNIVHRTQTSHHPDPYDPTPGKRGTTNYYGPLTYGRVSFAVVADRQYKSGPEGKIPPTGGRGDHITDPDYDPKRSDVPGLELLGPKQEQFLREWVTDWRGADLKAVISQTIFTAMATTHGGPDGLLQADHDTNAWPQTKRNEALRIIRKAHAFHLAGDQHLPAVVHYGIDTHQDAGVAFAGPAVNVGYPRWWQPARTKRNRRTGNAGLLGDFNDHFDHPLTVLAVKNMPNPLPKPVMELVNAKTSGLGVVRFNKAKQTVTVECWGYSADVTKQGTQMDGWPVTVKLLDNYARKAVAHLPELKVSGIKNPVIEVTEEKSGDLVYALRVKGQTFRPHVFAPGKYTIKVSDPDAARAKTVKGLEASADARGSVEVKV